MRITGKTSANNRTVVGPPGSGCVMGGQSTNEQSSGRATPETSQGQGEVAGGGGDKTGAKRKRGSEEPTVVTATSAPATIIVISDSDSSSGNENVVPPTGIPAILKDVLKCEGCQKVPASPIYTCEEKGHMICFLCYEKLLPSGKTCPSCPSKTLHLNSLAERLAKKLGYKLACPDADIGCKEEILSTDFQQHLMQTCFFRDIPCMSSNAVIKFSGWADHVRRQNFQSIWHNGTNTTLGIAVGNSGGSEYAGRTIYDNDFILRMQLTDTLLYVWMAIMADETEAKKYFATISLFGTQIWPAYQPAISWTLPVIPYHDPGVNEKTKSAFGTMGRKVFESTTTFHATLGAYRFNIKVEISKIPANFAKA